jgi:hypothetical protein
MAPLKTLFTVLFSLGAASAFAPAKPSVIQKTR